MTIADFSIADLHTPDGEAVLLKSLKETTPLAEQAARDISDAFTKNRECPPDIKDSLYLSAAKFLDTSIRPAVQRILILSCLHPKAGTPHAGTAGRHAARDHICRAARYKLALLPRHRRHPKFYVKTLLVAVVFPCPGPCTICSVAALSRKTRRSTFCSFNRMISGTRRAACATALVLRPE